MASDTVENYLKAVYALEQRTALEGAPVPAGELAAALHVTPGTATAMLRKLAAARLARYEKYGGVRLTAKGRRLALLVLRRHRIVETFLMRTLGFDWADVHDEAERLEHAVSDRLVDRLDRFLGHPAVDPHGDPIPGPDGRIREVELVALSTCRVGGRARVGRVLDQSAEFLQFVDRYGLRPGAELTVSSVEPGGGVLTLAMRGASSVTISHAAAAKLLVEVILV